MAAIGITIAADVRGIARRRPGAQGLDRRARHLRADRRAGARGDRRGPLRGARSRSRRATGVDVAAGPARRVLADAQLLRLNYGTFALHAVLMALFTQVPFALRDNGLAAERHWIVYLPVLVVSILLMLPFLRHVDRPGRGKPLFNGASGRAAGRRRSRSRCRCIRSSRSALRSDAVLRRRSTCSRRCCLRWSRSARPPKLAAPRSASIRARSSWARSSAPRRRLARRSCGRHFGLRLLRRADRAVARRQRDDGGASGLQSRQLLDGRNIDGFGQQGDPGRQSRPRSRNALRNERLGDLQHHRRDLAPVEGQGERRKEGGDRMASRRASTTGWPRSPANI